MDKLTNYFRDTAAELKQVSWPSQNQAMLYTGLVIGVSFAVSLFVALFDYIFSQGIGVLVK